MTRPGLLAILAHPDDETFRPGGTLALLAQGGVKVHVLALTHGEAGSCGEPAVCTRAELAGVRARELACACEVLGIEPPRLLDHSDGNLAQADPGQIMTQILAAAQQAAPQVLLSFGPDGLSGHPDHIAAGQWAEQAFHRLQSVAALYTLAVPQSLAARMGLPQIWPVPDERVALAVDVTAVWERKLAAMRCHATQWSSSPLASAPTERQRLFFGQEHFVRAAERVGADDFLPHLLQGHLK